MSKYCTVCVDEDPQFGCDVESKQMTLEDAVEDVLEDIDNFELGGYDHTSDAEFFLCEV